MTSAARSVFVFGWFLLGEGALLFVAPNLLFAAFGLPTTVEFWPRAIGVALCVFGLYYVLCARAELLPFFRFTVVGRTLQFAAFVLCVVLGWITPRILLVSGFELLAGMWTLWELRLKA
jgi:hypothetical protein